MSIIVKQNGQMENKIPANLQLYTMKGIVSRNPGTVVRIALPVFLAIIVILAAITWLVRYPEVVKATTVITGKSGGNLYDIQLGMPQADMHKFKAGQHVRLQFADYPNHKMGYVPGVIDHVVDSSSGYDLKLRVLLPGGLMTNRHHAIQYRPGMRAESIIFIRDLRLLQRMLSSSSRIFH